MNYTESLEKQNDELKAKLADVEQINLCLISEKDRLSHRLLNIENDKDYLTNNIRNIQKQYEDACSLVARMHEAAVGEARGPIRGVVQDVEDLRIKYEKLLRKTK